MNKIMVLMSILMSLCLLMVLGCDDELSADLPDGTETPELPCCGLVSNGCPEECTPCCNPVQPYPHRAWAEFKQTQQGTTGVSATIETQWGQICGAWTDEVDSALSCAWVAVQGDDYMHGWMWAQAGYSLQWVTIAGGYTQMQLYFEKHGSIDKIRVYTYPDEWELDPPPDGAEWEYKCELNDCCGDWYFSVNGDVYEVFEDDTAWMNLGAGSIIKVAGEVMNYEDDMVGTLEDPVDFSDCKSQVGTLNDFYSLGFGGNDSLFCTDWGEWEIRRVNNCTFQVWDNCQIP